MHRLAIARGAELGTFSGLAGVGDLTATMMAPDRPQPPRRRAARRGARRRRRSRRIIGQASEGLDAVPLLAEAVSRGGQPGRGARGLAALIRGEIDADAWIARPAPGRAPAEGGMSAGAGAGVPNRLGR